MGNDKISSSGHLGYTAVLDDTQLSGFLAYPPRSLYKPSSLKVSSRYTVTKAQTASILLAPCPFSLRKRPRSLNKTWHKDKRHVSARCIAQWYKPCYISLVCQAIPPQGDRIKDLTSELKTLCKGFDLVDLT